MPELCIIKQLKMKIIVTGSLGHISKPLTEELLQKGHAVTVISSDPEKQKAIETLGATAAIGTMEDVAFLTATFTGADAVYIMTPPNHMAEPDVFTYNRRLGENQIQAVKDAGVKRVVHLSSYGAELDKGTGMILSKYYTERGLNELAGVAVTHMRATYFYYNLYNVIGTIKHAGVIRSNYGGDLSIVMVSPVDIAAAVAEALTTPATGHHVQYLASDELTGNEIASILGAAIGKPDLQWVVISDEQQKANMLANGLPAKVVDPMIEMFSCLQSGELSKDYYLHKPAVMGKVKFADFVKEFAIAFNK